MKQEGKQNNTATRSCTLCGQLYNNFAFKGGYICEDCLQSIKDQGPPNRSKKD